ncbi:MAG: FlgD immunoglobulin-like domain containing protein [Rhodothermales bacterium]
MRIKPVTRRLHSLAVLLFLSCSAYAQVGSWETLDGLPRRIGGRYDDIFFATPETGWAVNGGGFAYRTTDAGETWKLVLNAGIYLRSVGFANTQVGWAGSLSNTTLLLQTSDGGDTWADITSRIPEPRPTGVCGLYVVSDRVVYGVGRFDGPPVLIKTADGGDTWSSQDLTAYGVGTLIDVYFFDENRGIAVGGTKRDLTGNAVVVMTEDGGATWSVRHTTQTANGVGGEWGWKISFPTPDIGYVSIEYPFSNPTGRAAKVLKTEDGGDSWRELSVEGSTSPAGLQGLGFVSPQLGWTSGRGTTSMTTDGGATWTQVAVMDGQVNRIRLINDTLAYAVGQRAYRWRAASQSTAREPLPDRIEPFELEQNYPNPFSASTTIRYRLTRDAHVRVRVIDLLGQDLRTLVDTYQAAGVQEVTWDGRNEAGQRVASGAYMYLVDIGDIAEMKTMVVLRD